MTQKAFFNGNVQYILFPESLFSMVSLHSALLQEQVPDMADGLGQICEGLSARAEILRLYIDAGAVITQEIHTLIRM